MGHFAFLTPFRGLEAAYDVHLGLIRKRVVDFLLVIIELFFARSKGSGATSEYQLKMAVFDATVPHQPFFVSEN